jgi:protein-arginine kinase
MEKGSDVKGVFTRLSNGVKMIEENLAKALETDKVFSMHPKFGVVTCCPSNLGTGMRGSVHILVPKLIAKIGFEAIDKLARERFC